MDLQELGEQMSVERQMLVHIEQALRVALNWDVNDADCTRNLSTLRFVAQSFQRHLNRTWALQQHGGYLDVVLDHRPDLLPPIEQLERDHVGLSATLSELILDMDALSPTDGVSFDRLRERLVEFLDDLKCHNEQETQLFQQAFTQEHGGEA